MVLRFLFMGVTSFLGGTTVLLLGIFGAGPLVGCMGDLTLFVFFGCYWLLAYFFYNS